MAKSDKSLVKVDVNIGNEESANKLLDKITGATGIIFGAYKEKQRAKSNFLAEINNRTDLSNIDKLHTTELGIERIKKNLELDRDNVVEYCKNKILDKNSMIYKKGKNWYCEIDNIIITINTYSYTIITDNQKRRK